ncbi:MAG: type II toxin-antitoxin system RelE/ParE family toxin [Betaproteobacteria bacterium]|nr:type II toxin-antitoxin system RelE/ParE family toxin [Betaproteobacteria bacterium]
MLFVELSLFQKLLSFSDEDLRKMRLAFSGRGKSGGTRVIYYWHASTSLCLLIFAYPKNVMDTLSDKQMKELVKLVRKEFGNG